MLDLLVAGGGPVGLATALYADRAGLSVAVVEPRTSPVDKACGEGLMPGAVAALSELEVGAAGHPFRGIRYTDGVHEATADFASGQGLGVRRTTLHACLAEAVAARGIAVHARTVGVVEQRLDRVCAAGLEARYLAAADGLHSPVRRQVGLVGRPGRLPRFGLRRHYQIEPWSDYVEVHCADGLEAYVTPVDDRLVGVALLTGRREPYDVQLAHIPALRHRLVTPTVTPVTPVRGAGPLRQRTAARVAGRVLLVGDAAGYVDALTGEGIAVGLATARALVAAVQADAPASYEGAWRNASRRYRWLTESLLAARQHRPTARLIVPGAQRLPRVFGSVVNQLAG